MPSGEQLGKTPIITARQFLESIVAGRDTAAMRKSIAKNLCDIYPQLKVAEITKDLEAIKPRRPQKEGLREQPVEEIYAIIEAAITLYHQSSDDPQQKRRPTLLELATYVKTDVFALKSLLFTKFSKTIRDSIVAPGPPTQRAKTHRV